ncbi:DUF6586 family protein [Saccharospirillum mangrovi]|uniref:DUF6586 family protein n=1 Tax=Saccharospirillum mangrovi TaxID=2161747 RepID=UPI000D3D172E|nr:DUF6586 family protein [Saccharospirillum mangrovi]
MNRRAQTNLLLYQARLMLDQAQQAVLPAAVEACEEAAAVFMHRALRAVLAEAAEAYGQSLTADRPVHELLRQLGEQRPDAWEVRTLKDALSQPEHWLAQLHQISEHWSGRVGQAAARPTASTERIELVAEGNDGANSNTTNHYRIWLADLQQWVDRIRELGDFH